MCIRDSRRAQRRAAAARLVSNSAAADGGLDECGGPTKQAKKESVEPKSPPAQELQLGERLTAGATVFVAKDPRPAPIATRASSRASRRS
eukprot:2552835-Prymnesium_polylepis.1